MHFAYEGFTHDGNTRCFLFQGVEGHAPASAFSIEIDLPLFMQHHIAIQEGPSFCLQLLTQASSAGAACLEKFHSYQVVGEDFRPLIAERKKRETDQALKRQSRRFYRKPHLRSNLHMGTGKSAV
jgi:hypothetical protein